MSLLYFNNGINRDIETAINEEIIGHHYIKKLIIKIIKNSSKKSKFKKLHLLLDGEPATGKTVFIKTIFNSIGKRKCIYYDASMTTQVGLLDHLINHGNLSEVRFICLDELDKMPKKYQFGVLNALELGIMKESKFRRHREVNLKDVTFFATSNKLDNIIEPLQTRFLIVNVPQYTDKQFNDVAFKLLNKKYEINDIVANQIIKVINENIPDRTIRDIVKFASLINEYTDINDLIQIFKNIRINKNE